MRTSCAYRYLRKHALETINIHGLEIDEMDIHWVITVPAIWSDGAKQFMREAAHKVTILNRLVLLLFCITQYCCYKSNSNTCKEFFLKFTK